MNADLLNRWAKGKWVARDDNSNYDENHYVPMLIIEVETVERTGDDPSFYCLLRHGKGQVIVRGSDLVGDALWNNEADALAECQSRNGEVDEDQKAAA